MITNSQIINEALEDMRNPEYTADAIENVCNIVFSEVTKSDAVTFGMMELYYRLISEPDREIRTMILNNLISRAALTQHIVVEFCQNVEKAVEGKGGATV